MLLLVHIRYRYLVVDVLDPEEVDPAEFIGGGVVLTVVAQRLNYLTHTSLVLQPVHVNGKLTHISACHLTYHLNYLRE